MKGLLITCILCLGYISVAQEKKLKFEFQDEQSLTVDHFIGTDRFDYYYTLHQNVIEKKGRNKVYVYNNIQLGNVEHVDISNPLKILVFYKDQNTIAILDNTLSEIRIVNFNFTSEFRKISKASVAYDNHAWIYNELNQEAELYNYIEDRTILKTLPFNEEVLEQKSNYNYCWIMTESTLYCYNIYGSLVSSFDNNNYKELSLYKNDVLLKKENSLFYLNQSDEINRIEIDEEISVKDFSITHETLYIYDSRSVHRFNLIK